MKLASSTSAWGGGVHSKHVLQRPKQTKYDARKILWPFLIQSLCMICACEMACDIGIRDLSKGETTGGCIRGMAHNWWTLFLSLWHFTTILCTYVFVHMCLTRAQTCPGWCKHPNCKYGSGNRHRDNSCPTVQARYPLSRMFVGCCLIRPICTPLRATPKRGHRSVASAGRDQLLAPIPRHRRSLFPSFWGLEYSWH